VGRESTRIAHCSKAGGSSMSQLSESQARAADLNVRLGEISAELARMTQDRDAKTKRMWQLGQEAEAAEARVKTLLTENAELAASLEATRLTLIEISEQAECDCIGGACRHCLAESALLPITLLQISMATKAIPASCAAAPMLIHYWASACQPAPDNNGVSSRMTSNQHHKVTCPVCLAQLAERQHG
jgi:hypothetical protein